MAIKGFGWRGSSDGEDEEVRDIFAPPQTQPRATTVAELHTLMERELANRDREIAMLKSEVAELKQGIDYRFDSMERTIDKGIDEMNQVSFMRGF